MIGFSTLLAGTYSGGSGTEVDPYQIANLNDLQEINQSTADWNSYFIQTADINASATATWDDGNGGSPEGFLPIANALDRFSGNYNGNDHIIDALTINRGTSDYAALFAYTNGSTISNLGLTNISVTGKMNIGALAGYNDNYSIIENCYSTGTVTASGYYCGGLVGYNIKYSEINNSYSSCTVNGSVNAGGITAYNHDHASINSSYFTGTVTGTNYVGGIIGSSASSSSINNCYTICEVVGEIFVGGFIGHNNTGTIDKCYSAGTISGDAAMGGFAGNNSGTISNSFWDTQTSGTNNGIAMGTNVGTLGLTTANMKLSSSYTPNGWDFTSIWAIESGANDNYPYLIDNPSSDVPLPITLAYFTATAIIGVI